MIISDGYNGTPSGLENYCEDEDGYTKWYVLHAEANAITKIMPLLLNHLMEQHYTSHFHHVKHVVF